jgi:hypothetical protein
MGTMAHDKNSELEYESAVPKSPASPSAMEGTVGQKERIQSRTQGVKVMLKREDGKAALGRIFVTLCLSGSSRSFLSLSFENENTPACLSKMKNKISRGESVVYLSY